MGGGGEEGAEECSGKCPKDRKWTAGGAGLQLNINNVVTMETEQEPSAVFEAVDPSGLSWQRRAAQKQAGLV